jgi:hypothetical protein
MDSVIIELRVGGIEFLRLSATPSLNLQVMAALESGR